MISRATSGVEAQMKNTFYPRFGKRILDIVGAGFGLMILSPLFLIVAALVKASGAGPVFFRQVRTGQFQKPFRIFKFRSMRASDPSRSALLTAAGDPRVTPLGRLLRKSKVDELPQLLNVFVGEMSLVGPRPEVPEYTVVYTVEQQRVFEQKPGITGPAAVRLVGEEAILAEQVDKHSFYVKVLLPAKLAMDLAYCANISFLEDLKLIFVTFASIFWKAASSQNPLLGMVEKQS